MYARTEQIHEAGATLMQTVIENQTDTYKMKKHRHIFIDTKQKCRLDRLLDDRLIKMSNMD